MNCRNDERAEIPRDVLNKFAELGAFGALVPPEYEGTISVSYFCAINEISLFLCVKYFEIENSAKLCEKLSKF